MMKPAKTATLLTALLALSLFLTAGAFAQAPGSPAPKAAPKTKAKISGKPAAKKADAAAPTWPNHRQPENEILSRR